MNEDRLGVMLRNAREAADMTQAELAVSAGVARSTIQRLEAGHVTRPQPRTLRMIAVALGYGLDWLR